MKNETRCNMDGLSKTQVLTAISTKFDNSDILEVRYNKKLNALIIIEYDGIAISKWRYENFVDKKTKFFNFNEHELIEIFM